MRNPIITEWATKRVVAPQAAREPAAAIHEAGQQRETATSPPPGRRAGDVREAPSPAASAAALVVVMVISRVLAGQPAGDRAGEARVDPLDRVDARQDAGGHAVRHAGDGARQAGERVGPDVGELARYATTLVRRRAIADHPDWVIPAGPRGSGKAAVPNRTDPRCRRGPPCGFGVVSYPSPPTRPAGSHPGEDFMSGMTARSQAIPQRGIGDELLGRVLGRRVRAHRRDRRPRASR